MSVFNDIGSLMQSGLRMADMARVFSTQGMKMILDGILGKSLNAPERLRATFEELGATYIKLGQLIASAPGLFPSEFVEEMQKCLDSVAPLSFSTIRKVMRKEFGGREDQLFASIEEKPIASASIAQVHGARLATGEDVVIKVQRPGIESKLTADLNLLYLAAAVFDRFAPSLFKTSLKGIVEDFHRTLMEEVDFIKEATNIEEFADFLDKIGEKGVMVPRVYRHATTLRVLTMERLYGVSLADLNSIRKYVKDPELTLVTALNTWFQSLAICGFFHADVHAGNLMVLTDGRVAFIDFGIVGRFEKKIWFALMNMMEALATSNFGLLAKSLVEMNATNREVDIKKFARQLEEIFVNFNRFGEQILVEGIIDEAQINKMLAKLVEVSEQNGLKIPREFALLFKQMLYFDRYIRLLAPDLDIMNPDIIKIYPDKNIFSDVKFLGKE